VTARYRNSTLIIAALACAICLGYFDLHSDDMFIIVGLVAGTAFVFGMIAPQMPWLWGILVGLGIPVAETIARLSHMPLPYAAEPSSWIGLVMIFVISLGIAMTGAVCGALLRRATLAHHA
jgi:hypothetical protein